MIFQKNVVVFLILSDFYLPLMKLYNTIRRNIKKYRKQQKMTAEQLSQRVGVSHDFIRQIESEKTAYNFSFIALLAVFSLIS